MIIGLSSGNFYRISAEIKHKVLSGDFSFWKKDYGDIVEIHLPKEKDIDDFLNKDFDFSCFKLVSIHVPKVSDKKDDDLYRFLTKLRLLKEKYGIYNFVFHIEKGANWELLSGFKDISISVENMDNDKNIGRSLREIGEIISRYDFNLTLDLQHCYTNDKSMSLACDFHKEFKNKIVEYHISGFCSKFKHYPLFKTKQDRIIKALEIKNIPMVIESTFDKESDVKKEIDYIKALI